MLAPYLYSCGRAISCFNSRAMRLEMFQDSVRIGRGVQGANFSLHRALPHPQSTPAKSNRDRPEQWISLDNRLHQTTTSTRRSATQQRERPALAAGPIDLPA